METCKKIDTKIAQKANHERFSTREYYFFGKQFQSLALNHSLRKIYPEFGANGKSLMSFCAKFRFFWVTVFACRLSSCVGAGTFSRAEQLSLMKKSSSKTSADAPDAAVPLFKTTCCFQEGRRSNGYSNFDQRRFQKILFGAPLRIGIIHCALTPVNTGCLAANLEKKMTADGLSTLVNDNCYVMFLFHSNCFRCSNPIRK